MNLPWKTQGIVLTAPLTHEVDDSYLISAHVVNGISHTGSTLWEVIGADDIVVLVKVIVDLRAAETVVAEGDYINTAVEDEFCRGGGDAVAVGGIFTVGNDHVYVFGSFESRKFTSQELAAVTAYDVADAENIHIALPQCFAMLSVSMMMVIGPLLLCIMSI